MISKKIAAQQRLQNLIPVMKCPICSGDLSFNSSIKCQKNHSFDISKQGYLNLENQAPDEFYNKHFFENRYEIIAVNNYYKPLLDVLNELVENTQGTMIDAGCGEGSFLNKIESHQDKIGIDLAKDAIALAAKHYSNMQFFVSDLSNLPFKNNTVDCVLSILSPANYAEFKRIMKNGAQIIKVLPGSNYFMEIREFFQKEIKHEDLVLNRFREEFPKAKETSVFYKLKISDLDRKRFCAMSPLTWNAEQAIIDQYIKDGPDELTIELLVLSGKKGTIK